MADCIYVIGGQIGPVKIGYSKCPKTRLGDLQIGSGERLAVLFELPHGNAAGVEAKVHRALRQYRQSGEWFHVPKEVAIAAIHMAATDLEEAVPKPPSEYQDWQVKDFPVEMRKRIVASAKAQHITVADWLHAYFARHPISTPKETFTVDEVAELLVEMAAKFADLPARDAPAEPPAEPALPQLEGRKPQAALPRS